MSKIVWDTSTLLMVLHAEPGWQDLVEDLDRAVISAVNFSEVAAKLMEKGMSETQATEALDPRALDVRSFEREAAWIAARLRPNTKALGLSLGDRSCLALGLTLGLPILTADRDWHRLDVEGLEVRLAR